MLEFLFGNWLMTCDFNERMDWLFKYYVDKVPFTLDVGETIST